MTPTTVRVNAIRFSLEPGGWLTARARLSHAPQGAAEALAWGAAQPGNVRCVANAEEEIFAQAELPLPIDEQAREACQARLRHWLTGKTAPATQADAIAAWEDVLLDGPWGAKIEAGVGTIPAAGVGEPAIQVQPIGNELRLAAELIDVAALGPVCRQGLAQFLFHVQPRLRMVRCELDSQARIVSRIEINLVEQDLPATVAQVQTAARRLHREAQAFAEESVAQAYLNTVNFAGR